MFMNNFFLLKKSCKLHTYLILYALEENCNIKQAKNSDNY